MLDDLLGRLGIAQRVGEGGLHQRPRELGQQLQVGGVTAGGGGDQEGEIGRAVLGAELDRRVEAGEGQRRHLDARRPAVRDGDAAREAGGEVASRASASATIWSASVARPASETTPREGADHVVLVGAEVRIEADQSRGDQVGHSVSLGGPQVADRDELGPDLGGVRDGRAGQSGGRAAVGDGERESLGGWSVLDVTEEVPEQAGVSCADGADDLGRRGCGVPGAVGRDQDGAVGAERGQDGLDAPLDQGVRRLRGRLRVGLEDVGVAAGEGGELLAVRLHQVWRGVVQPLDEGTQRRVAGVDRDPGARVAQGADQLGVPLDRGARGQRAGEHDPVGGRGAPPQRLGQPAQHQRRHRGSGAVQLRRGAVGLADGDVDPQRALVRDGAVVDAGPEQLQDVRVVLRGREHGDRRDAGGDRGAGDVHALAARLGEHGLGALDGTALEGAGEGHRPVVAGIGRERDDHAVRTSIPDAAKVAWSAGSMPVSVTSTSTSSSEANRTGASTPTLLASARTTTWRAQCTMARFTAASSWSGGREAVLGRDAVAAEEHHVGAEALEGGDGVGTDGRLGGRPDAAREQVQLDLRVAGQPRRHRHGMGEYDETVVAGEQAGQPVGGRACVHQHRRARRREQLESRAGDPLLLRSVRLVALDQARLDDGEAVGRYGAAVHAAYQAHPLEGRQVAPNRLGRDVVPFGEYVDRQASVLGDEPGPSPVGAPRRTSATVLSACADLCICCFRPVCVDSSRPGRRLL